MSDAPVWSGTIRVALTWRDCRIEGGFDLILNGFCIGYVYHRRSSDKMWAAEISTSSNGKHIGLFSSEQSAKDALVDAVVRELLDAE
jgi:hypothetical protein